MATIKGIKVGTTTITASFTDGGVTKTATAQLEVTAVSLLSIDTPSAVTYTGSAFTPTPAVYATIGGVKTQLTAGTDFTYSYENNTSAGTAKVIATAKDTTKYSGTVSATFTINKASITITNNSNQTYTYDTTAHGHGITATTVNKQTATIQYSTDGSTWSESYPTVTTANSSTVSGTSSPLTVYYKVSAPNHNDVTYNSSTNCYKIYVYKATPEITLTSASTTYPTVATATAKPSVAGKIIYYSETSGSDTYNTGSTAISANATANLSSMSRSTKGTTTIYAYLVPTDTTNYENSAVKSTTATVAARTVTITAPTFISTSLTYTGSAQALVNAGSASEGGTMYYFVSSDSTAPTTAPTSSASNGWTTTVSTRTDFGTYYVWYYVLVSDTTNNTGTGINTITQVNKNDAGTSTTSKTISRKASTISFAAVTTTLYYTGSKQNIGTITYSTEGSAYYYVSNSDSVPEFDETNTNWVQLTKSGTTIQSSDSAAQKYYVFLYVKGSKNYSGISVSQTTNNTFKEIVKANAVISSISGDSVEYEQGTAKPTVSYTGGTLYYRTSSDDKTYGDWTTTQPTRTAVGSTYVQCYVKGDSNHNDSSTSSAVTITVYQADDARATVTINSTELTYSGSAQNLVSSVTPHGCTVYIGLGTSSSSAPTSWTQITSTVTGITATSAGTYYIWYKFTPDSNHSNENTGTYVGSKVIKKDDPSASVNCSDVTYGSTVTATISNNPGNGTITWGITNGTGKASISTTGVVTPSQVGTVTITASVAETSNYNAYTTSKTITISKATGTITYSPSAQSVTFSTSSQTKATTAASGVKENATITYTLNSVLSGSTDVTSNGWKLSGTTLTIPASASAGSYTVSITANAAATTNYTAVSSGAKTFTLTINQYDQTMTITPTTATIYNTTGYNTVTITPSSNQGTVTYSSSDSTIATVSSTGVVTYVKAGTVTITATAAGNTNYKSGSKTCTVNCVVDTVKTYNALSGTITITQSKQFEAKGLTLTTSNIGTYFTYTTPCTQDIEWVSGNHTSGKITYTWSGSNVSIASLGTTATTAVTSRTINFTVTATGEGSKTSTKSVTSGNQEINYLVSLSLNLGTGVTNGKMPYGSSTTPTATATYTSTESKTVSATYSATKDSSNDNIVTIE